MKEIINDAARLRLHLLKETGYNVETAKKCWDFVFTAFGALVGFPIALVIHSLIF